MGSVDFAKNAEITAFRPEWVTFPKDVSSYTDDIKLEAYQKADLSFAGEQRKGIHQIFDD